VLAGAVYLTVFHLPLRADLSNLLPQDAPAVAGLRELETRVVSKDTTIVLVAAPDPARRAAATIQMIEGLRRLDRDLVERIDTDDRETREYIRAHRHLFVPLADLISARDTLAERIAGAKVRANPLFIDLDDDTQRADQAAEDKRRLDELRTKRREAEARLDRSSHVSADGLTAMILVRTTFNTADVDRARRLLPAVQAVAASVRAQHPGVTIGLAGGVPTSVAEYGAMVRGIILSTLVTTLLVTLVLMLHLRSVKLLLLLFLNTVIATVIAFGIAALTVGHLNAATAFLGAIIAGNGINFGIILIARYLEARRTVEPAEGLAVAIEGTLRSTLVAALGAAVAYTALISTSFQGFANFGAIAGVGMVVCWIASYMLLPVLLLRFARGPVAQRDSVFSLLVRGLRIRRPAVACAVGGILAVASSVIVWSYVAEDPFEYDLTKLRSNAPDAVAARDWMKVADARFGRGIWTRTYILLEQPQDVPDVIADLRAAQATPDGRATLGTPFSILDVVPPDQPRKLEVLAEIRTLLDDPGLEELAEPERRELRELRPPEDLAIVTAADLPEPLRREVTELDGRVGNLILIPPAKDFDELDGHQLLRLATVIRQIDLGEQVVSGASLIFADIITAIRRDGLLVTVVAALGLVFLVGGVVGRNRRSLAVLLGTFTGTLVMIAVCALVGIKVNFLDYMALPITLGLGIDYAINVADRTDRGDAEVALRMTGSSVLVCSLTTIIGYASLLVSDNLAIKGFGVASLIGEITCVTAALTLVPAIVALGRRDAPDPIRS
jgi:predicted RND superfamily exporter protein